MSDNLIEQYVAQGGRLFTVERIDTIRDGGTKIIRCTNSDTFYIDKDLKNFYVGYPGENPITDKLLLNFLLNRIETYVIRQGEEHERNVNLIEKLKQ